MKRIQAFAVLALSGAIVCAPLAAAEHRVPLISTYRSDVNIGEVSQLDTPAPTERIDITRSMTGTPILPLCFGHGGVYDVDLDRMKQGQKFARLRVLCRDQTEAAVVIK